MCSGARFEVFQEGLRLLCFQYKVWVILLPSTGDKLKILSYKNSSMIILVVTSIQAFNYIVLFLGCLMGIPYILWQPNDPLRSVSFFGKSFPTWDSQRVQHMAESYGIIWGSMIPAIFFATSLGTQVTMGFPPTFRTKKDNLSETWKRSNKKNGGFFASTPGTWSF